MRRQKSCFRSLLVVALLLAHRDGGLSEATATGGSGCGSTKTLVEVTQQDETQARIGFVRTTLCERLEYVTRGKREGDFKNWVKSQGGEAKIFSMHGADVNFDIAEVKNMGSSSPTIVTGKGSRKDPFLANRMNLRLSNSTDNRFHPGLLINLSEDKAPTVLQLSLRAIKLSLQFAPVLTTAWIAAFSQKFRRAVWYKWIAHCLGASGAAFIKWGQWASTRSDMFPLPLCDALSDLHSDAPAHSWEFTRAQVEASLDIPPGTLFDVFKTFDEKPLASGSIAQVHKAQLQNGAVVAAKVRHPRVAKLIDMDFRLMTFAASICDWLPSLRGLHIKESVSQFSHTMAAQAHLNVEGHHLEVLNHNFRSWRSVQFPKPIYASSALILETFERGTIVTGRLDEFDLEGKSIDPPINGYDLIPLDEAKFLVTTGVSMYLKMLLLDNLMHADLHPGNIMLYGFENELGKGNFQITLVDAGMVAQLTDEESTSFVGLIACLGEGDGAGAAEFALRFSIENEVDGLRKERFKQDMVELFKDRCRGYGTNVDVGEVLRGVLGLIREHHIRIDANYATLVINVLCVESLGQRICPAYNVLDAARPLLQAYRRVAYQNDGYTLKQKDLYSKKIKQLMPLLLYGNKKRADKAAFKQIEASRRKRITAVDMS